MTVELDHDDDSDSVRCEGCGTELPSFLEACPYCDAEDEREDATLPCPACGAEIYEDSTSCAICGAYVTPRVGGDGAGRRRLATVVIIVLVLALFGWMIPALKAALS